MKDDEDEPSFITKVVIIGVITIISILILVGVFMNLQNPTCKLSGGISINNPHSFAYYDNGIKFVPEAYGNGNFSYEGPCKVLETMSNNRLIQIN